MNKSASRAFYAMICGIVSFGFFGVKRRKGSTDNRLHFWAVSVIIYALSTLCFKKLENDKNRIEYRAKYDMKQEDLAKLVGVRRETINLEKGIFITGISVEPKQCFRNLLNTSAAHRRHHRAGNLERGSLLFLCPDTGRKEDTTCHARTLM